MISYNAILAPIQLPLYTVTDYRDIRIQNGGYADLLQTRNTTRFYLVTRVEVDLLTTNFGQFPTGDYALLIMDETHGQLYAHLTTQEFVTDAVNKTSSPPHLTYDAPAGLGLRLEKGQVLCVFGPNADPDTFLNWRLEYGNSQR